MSIRKSTITTKTSTTIRTIGAYEINDFDNQENDNNFYI